MYMLCGVALAFGITIGYMLTGGAETIINVYPLDSPSNEPKYALIGHKENVCALNASSSGLIISGSWDRLVLPLYYSLFLFPFLPKVL